MICNFGDVVVVPFPFVDRPISKLRPAVVLSSGEFNATHDQSLFAMITTGSASEWPSDIAIDWRHAGLNHPCVIRWKLFTLQQLVIVRRTGQLAQQDLASVIMALRSNLGMGSE